MDIFPLNEEERNDRKEEEEEDEKVEGEALDSMVDRLDEIKNWFYNSLQQTNKILIFTSGFFLESKNH